jgi:alkylation response protein AidB-like acyl-CoA dehydrogenase
MNSSWSSLTSAAVRGSGTTIVVVAATVVEVAAVVDVEAGAVVDEVAVGCGTVVTTTVVEDGDEVHAAASIKITTAQGTRRRRSTSYRHDGTGYRRPAVEPHDSPAEAAFRAEARAWLDANATRRTDPVVIVSAIVAEWTPEEEEAELAIAKAWQREKYDAGWAGIHWSTEHGGRGGTPIESLIFRQEELHYDVPADALGVGLDWLGPAVAELGDPELAAAVLPDLLSGDHVWCQLFSETAAGSDLAGLETRAVRDGDEWVVNGQKTWTTVAHLADRGLLITRHDPDAPKHRGLTAFLVDMDSPGITVNPIKQMTGAANFNEVFFDDVRIPDSRRVGEVGDGWRVAVGAFAHERFSDSFSNTDAIEALAELLRGTELTAAQRDRFADLYARSQALRYTGMRLLTEISQGRQPGPEGSVLKLAGPQLLSEIYEMGLESFGPGATLESNGDWSAGFLGIPGLIVGGGTPPIQRNIIGERLLGLPPDVRVDKDKAFRDVPNR